MQQNGASKVMTMRPAQICQIPATMQSGEKLMQHQNPKKTATAKRNGENGAKNMVVTRTAVLTNSSANSGSFGSVFHIPRRTTLFSATSTATPGHHIREEVLHSDVAKLENLIVLSFFAAPLLSVFFLQKSVSRKSTALPESTLLDNVKKVKKKAQKMLGDYESHA